MKIGDQDPLTAEVLPLSVHIFELINSDVQFTKIRLVGFSFQIQLLLY